jgi:hypothetical protein
MMKPEVVAVGIDTLNVGFNIREYRVDSAAFKQLEEGKQSAGDKLFGGKGVTVKWGDREFNLLAKGTKGYEYILKNDDIRLSQPELSGRQDLPGSLCPVRQRLPLG